jgi:two-component system, NtrC family, response regulator AtoC
MHDSMEAMEREERLALPRLAPGDVEDVGGDVVFMALGPEMRKIRAQAEMLAKANVPVLVLGERGTEKEAVARLVHKFCFGESKNFFKVSCSSPHALRDQLRREAEIELGEDRLDSARTTEGARGCSIFLDDVVALPVPVQAELLQALPESRPLAWNASARRGVCRILAASEPAIEQAVRMRKLRADLYDRLRPFTLQVPPLRQRKNEIESLLSYTIHRLAERCGVTPRPVSLSIVERCERYAWPGNFRELEDFARQYLLFGEENPNPGTAEQKTGLSAASAVSPMPPDVPSQVAGQGSDNNSLLRTIRWESERKAVAIALERTRWNRKAAARLLKVSYRTLLYKISQYKVKPQEQSLPPDSSMNGQQRSEGQE